MNVEAIAARPGVDVEEGGSDRVQVERRLHAKVLIVDGPSTSLAYLGSANFSLPGWGFIAGAYANIEAGVALRAGVRNDPFGSLVPPVTGNPVKLEGDGRARIHTSTPEEPEQTIPWPWFCCACGTRASGRDGALDLTLELDSSRSPRSWSVALDEHTAPLEVSGAPESVTRGAVLSPEALSALIRNQTVHVRWDACEAGAAYPINVLPAVPGTPPAGRPQPAARRGRAPSPSSRGASRWRTCSRRRPRRHHRVVGRAPTRRPAPSTRAASSPTRCGASSRRSPGVRGELVRSAVSEPSIRFAALGPVGPVALAREVVRAVGARRSGVAAGFQGQGSSAASTRLDPQRCPTDFVQCGEVLDDARGEVVAMLRALRAGDANLAKGTRFGDYCVEMCRPRRVGRDPVS